MKTAPGGAHDSGPAAGSRPRIGDRLRRGRRQRELTIEQLAQATGLTKGFLSQVERDRANVSVASLLRICEVLGLRVGELFDDGESGLVTAERRPALHFGGAGVQDFLLTPRTSRNIQVIQSTVAPGGNSEEDDGDPPYRTRSDAQFIHVTKGEFEITLDGEVFRLRAGDSLTFTGREKKSWRNPSADEDAELLWMLTPSLF